MGPGLLWDLMNTLSIYSSLHVRWNCIICFISRVKFQDGDRKIGCFNGTMYSQVWNTQIGFHYPMFLDHIESTEESSILHWSMYISCISRILYLVEITASICVSVSWKKNTSFLSHKIAILKAPPMRIIRRDGTEHSQQ